MTFDTEMPPRGSEVRIVGPEGIPQKSLQFSKVQIKVFTNRGTITQPFSMNRYFLTITFWAQCENNRNCAHNVVLNVIFSRSSYFLTIKLWAQFLLFSNCAHNVIVRKYRNVFRYFHTIKLYSHKRSHTLCDTFSVDPNSSLSHNFLTSAEFPQLP